MTIMQCLLYVISGHLIVFKHPYPRDIDEIHDYSNVTEHFIPEKKISREVIGSIETKTYSVSNTCTCVVNSLNHNFGTKVYSRSPGPRK